jgi:3-oxoacyl-[acyl-carrier protein] reductase
MISIEHHQDSAPEELGIANEIVLITGGGTGIGRAVAELFLWYGAICIVNYIDDADLENIQEFGGDRCFPFKADISNKAQVDEMFKFIAERWGHLDTLVSNAGIHRRTDTQTMSEDIWEAVINVNLKGAFLVSQGALKLMMGKGGKLVFVSSDTALKGSTGGGAHYCASKGGLLGLSNALAREFAGSGIRVNSVLPGLTSTKLPNISDAEFRKREQGILLGRAAEPLDIAKAILFFGSSLSDYITGQSLIVNGGQPVR